VTEAETRPRVGWLNGAAVALLALFLVTQVSTSLYDYATRWYQTDEYQFLDVAREVASGRIAHLAMYPNSSAGLDLVYWDFFLQPHIYAIYVSLFDIQIHEMQLAWLCELALALLLIFLALKRQVPLRYVLPLMAVIVFDGVFNIEFVGARFQRQPLILGMASFLCFLPAVSAERRAVRAASAYALGVFGALAPLSFIATGTPIAVGFGLAFLVECWARREARHSTLISVGYYALGALTPLAGVAFNLAAHLDAEAIARIGAALQGYASVVVNQPAEAVGGHESLIAEQRSSFRGASLVGYFFASLILPIDAPALVPIGIAAVASNALRWDDLDARERQILRLTAVLLGTWLLLALIVPTHFVAPRMSWMLPLFAPQLLIALRRRRDRSPVFACFIAVSLPIVVAQLLFHGLGQPGGAYGMAAFAGAALATGGATACGMWLGFDPTAALRSSIERRAVGIVLVLLALLVLPGITGIATGTRIQGAVKELRRNGSLLWRQGLADPLAERLAEAVRRVARTELSRGDRVLTNAPMSEFFGEGIRRQDIFTYRGLFGGATRAPADRVFLFASQSAETPVPGYGRVEVGQSIYYRGFAYSIEHREQPEPGIDLFVGEPDPDARFEDLVYPSAHVPQEAVEGYLRWRSENGLPID
jgi:hypothetical protein